VLKEMFGSPKPKKNAPAVVVKTPAPPAPAVPPVSQTVLGAGTQFEGNLRAEGSVRVDGTFVGDITTRARILIGEQASVDGNLVGESVDVAGIVRGDVTARRISVMHSGRILGDLRLEKLTTEEGGFIQGLVRMEEKVDISAYLPAKSAPVEEPQEQVEPAEASAGAEVEAEPVPVPAKAKVAGKGGK
jgi:cytoskeletal protein CcmA (bactofilin family)